MTGIQEHATERLRKDHEYMLELAHRIKASCSQTGKISSCYECKGGRLPTCHGNVDELIRNLAAVTLKHDVLESILMDERVPSSHRVAHRQAHLEISRQLQAIRVVLSADGDCIVAIEEINEVLVSLTSHFEVYDRQLSEYLLLPV